MYNGRRTCCSSWVLLLLLLNIVIILTQSHEGEDQCALNVLKEARRFLTTKVVPATRIECMTFIQVVCNLRINHEGGLFRGSAARICTDCARRAQARVKCTPKPNAALIVHCRTLVDKSKLRVTRPRDTRSWPAVFYNWRRKP